MFTKERKQNAVSSIKLFPLVGKGSYEIAEEENRIYFIKYIGVKDPIMQYFEYSSEEEKNRAISTLRREIPHSLGK